MASFLRSDRGRSGARRHLSLMIVLIGLVCSGFVPGLNPATRAQTAGDSLYAVLYCGSSDYYVYRNELKFAFKTLINDYGYTKENVLVLLKTGWSYDLDGDGIGDVDFAATKENVDTVFARLKRVVTQGDVFFFFATDHGYYEASNCHDAGLCVYEGNSISEEDLAGYFGSLDTPTRRITKILLFNTCSAGGMIPELDDLESPIMISTASKACEVAHYDNGSCLHAPTSCHYSAYSFWWFAAVHGSDPGGTWSPLADTNHDGYVTIEEAAKCAKASDEFAQPDSKKKEHPMYFDKGCIWGKMTTLGGRLPGLPKVIAFYRPCGGPLPCRWRSWRCDGGGLGPVGEQGARSASGPGDMGATLWTEPEPAPGETTYVYAKVYNDGDAPIMSSVVNFYYSDPTLSLVFPQTGLNDIATVPVAFLPPHDSLVVGPVPFVPPPGNSFGEPHWTLMAVAENYDSPVETGWLVDDDHVAAGNRFELKGYPEEPKTIHLSAQNPLDVPVKALLSLDDDHLPPGWTVVVSPAVGDTIELAAESSVPIEVVLTGVSGVVGEGFVDISMSLNTTTVEDCESCDDSTCGGYIGDAGGCSIKLVLEGTVPVFAPEFAVSATLTAITLTWQAPARQENRGFNVYRGEKGSDERMRLNDTPILGSGQLSYMDEAVVPGKTYVYVIGILTGESELLSAPKEVSLAEPLGLELRQNYPNPFNPTTTISFSLPERTRVTLAIYDVEGRLVVKLEEGVLDAGVTEYTWDGTDSQGKRVSSGVYFCRLTAGGQALSEKMILTK